MVLEDGRMDIKSAATYP